MLFSLDLTGLTRFQRKLRAYPSAFAKAADRLDEQQARSLLDAIRARAPRATGTYAASWYVRRTDDGWRVATDHPAAWRLERGFYGVDSLGRNYAQAGRPHVAPAKEQVRLEYAERKRRLVKEVWRSL